MDHFTQVKAAEDIKCQDANIRLKSYKTSMKQLSILKFPFKNGTSLTINVQVVPENSLKTLPLWFFSEQDKRFTVKKPTRSKSLRANQCLYKSVFSYFSTERKLIDDSFELSGSHLCLKTVNLAGDTTKITAVSIFFS